MIHITTWRAQVALLTVVAAASAAGFVVDGAWQAVTVVGLAYSTAMVLRDLSHRRFGIDVLATLSLAGTLLTGEYLAGALVAVMLCTGQVLEGYASRRAHRDLDELLARAPRQAQVRRRGTITAVPVGEVVVGEVVLLRAGDVAPVDGRLCEPGEFDESALTGESLPVGRSPGEIVRSGVRNAGAAVEIRTVRCAADSAYAGVVRVAERALAGTAPVARLADRFAIGLVPFALVVAVVAWWWSGDVVRAVAVLVTATPCPLLLAV